MLICTPPPPWGTQNIGTHPTFPYTLHHFPYTLHHFPLRYPVIIKAAMGGGGRGMRVVNASAELEDNFHLATSEVLQFIIVFVS